MREAWGRIVGVLLWRGEQAGLHLWLPLNSFRQIPFRKFFLGAGLGGYPIGLRTSLDGETSSEVGVCGNKPSRVRRSGEMNPSPEMFGAGICNTAPVCGEGEEEAEV